MAKTLSDVEAISKKMIVPVGQNVSVDLQVFSYFEYVALATGNIWELRSGQTAFRRRENRLKEQQRVKQEC